MLLNTFECVLLQSKRMYLTHLQAYCIKHLKVYRITHLAVFSNISFQETHLKRVKFWTCTSIKHTFTCVIQHTLRCVKFWKQKSVSTELQWIYTISVFAELPEIKNAWISWYSWPEICCISELRHHSASENSNKWMLHLL